MLIISIIRESKIKIKGVKTVAPMTLMTRNIPQKVGTMQVKSSTETHYLEDNSVYIYNSTIHFKAVSSKVDISQ